MKDKERAMELGVAKILECIDEELDRLYDRRLKVKPENKPQNRAKSLLDLIHNVTDRNLDYLGIAGGSLLERTNNNYEVIKQFGERSSTRTGSSRRKSSFPLEELKENSVLFKYNPSKAPRFIRNKTIMGLDEDLDYIVILNQKNGSKYQEPDKKAVISHIAGESRRYLRLRERQLEVETTLTQREATLRLAHQLQSDLIQEEIPEWEGYDLHAHVQFADEVGGDYYLLDEPGSLHRIVLLDAINHGLPASIICGKIHELLWNNEGLRPEATVQKINERLHMAKESSYTSLLYMELSKKGNLAYTNAGHPYPLLFYRGRCRELKENTSLLGIDPKLDIPIEHTTLRQGEVLALYSDGITDAFDREGKTQWGLNRLKNYIRGNIELSAKEIVQGVYRELQKFSGRETFGDDASLIVVKKL